MRHRFYTLCFTWVLNKSEVRPDWLKHGWWVDDMIDWKWFSTCIFVALLILVDHFRAHSSIYILVLHISHLTSNYWSTYCKLLSCRHIDVSVFQFNRTRWCFTYVSCFDVKRLDRLQRWTGRMKEGRGMWLIRKWGGIEMEARQEKQKWRRFIWLTNSKHSGEF